MPPKTRTAREGETRSQQEEDEQVEATTAPAEAADPGAAFAPPVEGAVAELSNLVRTLLQVQTSRDEKWEKVMQSQDQRWRAMTHQFNLLQGQVEELREGSEGSRSATPQPPAGVETRPQLTFKEPKLHPLTKEDDIEHFLATFERVATTCRWPDSTWAIRLVPLLTGKARSAFVAMDIQETEDYEKVKEAILKKYNINADTYRVRFRSAVIMPDETPKELYVRLKELFLKWVRPEEHSLDDICELMVLEQFMDMVSPDMTVWIREHDPKTAEEAARLAEIFQAARQGTRGPGTNRWTARKSDGGGESRGQYHQRPSFNRYPDRHRQEVRCTNCGKLGHTKPNCQARGTQNTTVCYTPRPHTPRIQHSPNTEHLVQVLVNGEAANALVDTGSSQTLIHESLVPGEQFDGQPAVKVCCVHGDVRSYPTVEVFLTVSGQTFFMPVAIAAKLPYKVVLGNDLPILWDLIHKLEHCNAVTRAQSAKDLQELPFADVELDVADRKPEKPHLSRQQKRRQKVQTVIEQTEPELWPQPELHIDMDIPTNIAELQRQDKSLEPWFNRAADCGKPGSLLKDERYVVKNGILYQIKGQQETLVVPKPLRCKVMTLAHSIPWSGHLGKYKTLARLGNRFSWPNIYTDITDFVRTCPECQLTSGKAVPRAPLHPLPIIDTPFTRIGMDIVGPLDRSKRGNRYILVMCDYATRYPEAFPLKNIKARQVANCLVQLFTRVGVPREIVTDQGTNFMSVLLKQVYSLLGVKAIKTTPYHPQTDGLVERFNRTLKTMLRRFVSQTGTDWDDWLPYLLFAYREVPQASTGFSPFELLYGRQVRGPLDLLKDMWEEPKAVQQNVATYVLQMRQRLEEMSELAHQNMELAQKRQKTWYDQKARGRTFEPGQKVLLLLPTEESKLLAKWHGPYEVIRKVGQVTYEVSMPDRGKKKQTFHVNLLKEYHRRDQVRTQLFVRAVAEEEEADEQFFPVEPNTRTVDLSHLEGHQQNQLRALLDPDLFQERPGRTTLVAHDIVLKPDTSPQRRSYRVPERLLPALKEELDVMLSLGVIEPSCSDWCSPVVLVPKRDGSIRFCIDFRQVNALSKVDPYPMPRINELVERLGKAKYITTIDLSRGYWQVPLSPRAKEVTAFRTPFGLYHFNVMPVGLQGAPASFQRLMDRVLRGTHQFAAAYLDDVCIWSNSWEEHCRHLRQVLNRIREAGLTINPGKCALAKQEVHYLGYVIGGGVIRPQVEKVDAIQSCAPPTTKRKVRAFLGLVGWYRRFIPDFSARSSPLSELWTEQCEAAFQDLKGAVCSDSVLLSPDFHKPFIVQTDASGVGLGAVLLQEEDGQRRPVAFISRKLFDRERRYAAVELEALAIKWALDSLRYYLLGRPFKLETDHRALQWLDKMRDTNSRVTRWYLSLQPYDYTVEYRPGSSNRVADFLSRIPEDEG
ncbi:hypothetical protein ACEWY4_023547 [Coilia grayii]|uniref:Gypsy retrotransposon integrase-like protein 1 n=1 Tax=Coilia grayii TaxID=363190 RepID=A0ABD1J3B8_9TELE